MEADKTLDAKDLNCPLPILKAKKALRELEVSQVLEVITTDPSSVSDFRAFCRITGHQLVSDNQDDGIFTFFIRKN